MLYKKNVAKELSAELFKNPTSEYRAAPFWAWNCELTPELLTKEIEYMKEMGFGGFHIHPRVGLATPYLTDEFMDLVGTCVEKARKENMLAWLYDEDKWPSGFAGGYITQEMENRQKDIFFTPFPYNDGTLTLESDIKNSTDDIQKSKYYFLAAFDVCLNDGFLASYKRIGQNDKAENDKWFAYVIYRENNKRYNNQSYVDTLKKSAIEEFVNVTHERYKKRFGNEFDKLIPAIFTDEPQFSKINRLNFSYEKKAFTIPFTTDIDDTYKAEYGESVVDKLPELFWELADGKAPTTRYHYLEHITKRFVEAYADTVGKWCEKNNIALTGHVVAEPTLSSQTGSVGEAMRSYRGFGIPGIDMLADLRELTTAKQCQSAVHQYGREGMLSELYGVTNWTFDFRGHKLQGDWQAALGVTVRVPHLFWVSMLGEGKRDYPASIGYQSPWYKEYKYVEDHFARVNTLMTRGTPDVSVAVIHPIESFWLHFGPNDKTANVREDMERRFKEITEWLLYGNVDFDFVSESLLADIYDESGEDFTVGKMKYMTVIIPFCETIRSSTLSALKKFADKGGKVIVMGDYPTCVDATKSEKAFDTLKSCTHIPWAKGRMLDELEEIRTLWIRNQDGTPTDNLIYQCRNDGEKKNIFISHVNKPTNYDTCFYERYFITLNGEYKITEYDTLSGEIKPREATYSNSMTTIEWVCGACSSLLISAEKGRNEIKDEIIDFDYTESRLPGLMKYRRHEPNVLLLDTPEYSINGGEFYPAEYVLFADDNIRDELKIRRRNAHMAQPWVEPYDKNPKESVTLRYKFISEIEANGCKLAMESSEYAQIYLNGEKVDMTVDGYYVDEDGIKSFRLPIIKKGENELKIEYRFGDVVQLEACYLVGDFGVQLDGRNFKIVEEREYIGFDDICSQGMPFYGGNIDYITEIESDGEEKIIEINKYRGAVISVDVDGKRVGVVAYPPYRLSLGKLPKGKHELKITLYGNRMNTFGTLHNIDENIWYCSSHRWRDKGRSFVPEYLVHETGITSSPRILTVKEK
ncbi:MAG: hypothetical protein IJR55_04345 [Clostridia bacterium]|nr:hypothetical protein [Clostridia bacterium]